MTERLKLIVEGLDVAPLLAKLAEHPELWAEHTERQHYPGSAHKDTETIYLRWAKDASLLGAFYDLTSEDHVETISALAPEIFPIIDAAIKKISPFYCPWPGSHAEELQVGRVILTKLKPGGVITEHVDEGPYADRYDRFHVCLSGDSGFWCDGQIQGMKPGQLWWFNHKLPHWVQNGPTDRIHLILDLVAPEYRKLRGLTFQRERPHELLDEARPLFEAHYHEIAHYPDIALDINEAAYLHLEESNLLRCYTARYNGELVGYCVFLVRLNLRYSSSLQATQDILYVDKTKRGVLFGKRLLDYCEARLKAEGVQVVYQHAKVTSTVGTFFERCGYTLIDGIYGKRLDQ